MLVEEALDLCSGTGRAAEETVKYGIRKNSPLPKLYLSDLFPDLNSFEQLKKKYPDNIDYIAEPLDMMNPPLDKFKLFTICAAFHHLKQKDASRVLNNFLVRGGSLIIFEPLSRSLLNLVMMIIIIPVLVPIYAVVSVLARPRCLISWLFCLIVPIIPLMVCFDGIISILRTYTRSEIEAMLSPQNARTYSITFKKLKTKCPIPSYACLIERK